MKVLHLCLGNFYLDNGSYQENMLPKYHVKQGHEVLVIASLESYDKNGEESFIKEASSYHCKDGYNIIRLTYKKPKKLNLVLRHFKGLKEEIENFQPDVIFSHNLAYGDTPIIRNYIKKHPKVKLFADNHGDYINSAKNFLSKYILHPIIWRHYAKVLEPYLVRCYGVTPMRCRFLKEMYHINPEKVMYLPLGVDDDAIPQDRMAVRKRIREELSVKESDVLIFTGGKIDRLKNIHILIDAFEKVNKSTVHMVICGVLTHEMSYLEEKISDHPSNIHYLGWCDAPRVMECMVASDFACFPGTHSTLWEQAVGVGLPAIFKRWPEMEHVNVNGNCVFVKGEDVDEIVTSLSELSAKGNKYNELKSNSEKASLTLQYSEIAKRAIEF